MTPEQIDTLIAYVAGVGLLGLLIANFMGVM